MPADPANVTIDATNLSKVIFTYTAVAGVDGYRFYRRRTSVTGATYLKVFEGTALTFTDTLPNYDMDTSGSITAEQWEFLLVSFDGTGESSGRTITVNMPAMTTANITAVDILDPTYNDGASQTATYSTNNNQGVTPVVDDNSQLMHETRLRNVDAYGRHSAN